MRTLSLALIGLIGCASSTPPPPPPAASNDPPQAATPPAPKAPVAPVALEEYFKIRRVGSRGGILLSFSHDEALVAYLSDEGGRADIWVQPVAGGAATQITHANGFVQNFAFSPKADQLVYESDVGGNELPHLFLTDSKGTAPRDLNPDMPATGRTQFIEWAEDGKTFVFLSSQRDPQALDLCEYNLATGKTERLWEGSGKLAFADISRDHTRFIIAETNSDADSNLYLVERSGKGKSVLLTKHQGEIMYEPRGFSKDKKTLLYTSDEAGEFNGLYSMDLASHKSKPTQKAEWDVEGAGYSNAWKYFYVTTNVDGTISLELKDAGSGKPVALPTPPPGGAWVPLAWSASDRFLGVRMQSDAAPTSPYVIDLKQGTARQLIDPLPASLRERKMVVGKAVRIPSFDQKPLPAFLYQPEGDGPFPAIIDVHGGPTSQSRREFDRMRQYLVAKGYVVLVPNVRGSTGYGKSWTKLDNHDLGGGPLQDVVTAKKWLVAEAKVDAARVVVLGGSYGGYMALAAATFTPTEFAANVDYFGVSDLKSLVESFPPYWAAAATFIYKKFGDPKNPEDAKYQHDRSPANFVEKIERPLLVVQGDKDARVKKDQSDRIVSALEQRKVPVHYLVLTDEGHGFSKNENYLAAYRATDRFLDRYLWGDTSVNVLSQ